MTLFSDESIVPLAVIQSLDNRSGVLACCLCGAFVGSARAQVAAATLPRNKKDLEVAVAEGALPALQAATDVNPTVDDLSGAEFCRNGCGEIFCSSTCEISAFAKGHALTCVGTLTTTDHPLYELKVAAVQSGHYEIVTLATKLVAMAIAEAGDGPASDFFRSSAVLAAQPPWDEGAGDGDDDGDSDDDESFTSITWGLVAAAFDVAGHTELCGDRGANLWPRLLGYVASRAVEVDRRSPVFQYCLDAPSAPLSEGKLHSLRERILAWTEQLAVERAQRHGEDDENGPPTKKIRHGADGDERSFCRLLDESDSRLPRFHGSAICPRLDMFDRSCVPNCKSSIVKGNGAISFHLQSATSSCASATICPFPTSLSLVERSTMWKQRGYAQECKCARCVYEGNEGGAHAVSLDDLRQIVQLAQDDQRFDDALKAFGDILATEPKDGDALFGRARVTSWDDRWSEAHRLMTTASGLAPQHKLIQSHLADEQIFAWQGPLPSPKACTIESFTRLAVGNTNVYASCEGKPTLSPDECAQAIIDAEEYVAGAGGWTTQRHHAVPTTDVQVQAIPKLRTWFSRTLQERIYPALALQYGVRPCNMRVIDAFVVKYDANAQRYLPVHQDQSQYSLTLSLNSDNEYVGGGTYFVETGQVVNCSAGGMVSFPGKLLHGGHPISRGIRYIIVALLYEYKDHDHLQTGPSGPTQATQAQATQHRQPHTGDRSTGQPGTATTAACAVAGPAPLPQKHKGKKLK